MNTTTPHSHPLPERIVDVLVGAIRDAYRENAPLQLRALGHDDWTFALTNFKTIKHFLAERLSNEGIVVEYGNSLWLVYEGHNFYIHKLGRSEHDDPWSCVPNHPGPAGHAAQLQLAFELNEIPVAPRIWVVAHYGNLEDGACAIRLQASGAAEEGKISSWVRVIDLWQRPDAGFGVATGHQLDSPAPVEVGEPELEVKRSVERQSETGEGA